MKKVFFVLAMVAVFGFATSTASANVVTIDNTGVELVADNSPEGTEVKKEEAKTEKKAEAKSEAKSEGCAAKKESGASCGGK